jgi:hypothetical protein
MRNATQVRFTGESGFHYLLQYSDDLQNWTTWTNTVADGGSQTFAAPAPSNAQRRFYRSLSVQ